MVWSTPLLGEGTPRRSGRLTPSIEAIPSLVGSSSHRSLRYRPSAGSITLLVGSIVLLVWPNPLSVGSIVLLVGPIVLLVESIVLLGGGDPLIGWSNPSADLVTGLRWWLVVGAVVPGQWISVSALACLFRVVDSVGLFVLVVPVFASPVSRLASLSAVFPCFSSLLFVRSVTLFGRVDEGLWIPPKIARTLGVTSLQRSVVWLASERRGLADSRECFALGEGGLTFGWNSV